MTESDSRFSDEEWGLLVGLPQSIVVAASAAESDGGKRTEAENEAGQTAIAEGRESGNPLVEEVSRRLVELVGDPEEGQAPPVIELPDPPAAIADVLARARTAAQLLAQRAEEADAAAYKHWLVTIADQVVTASRTGNVMGLGDEIVTEAERRFRDRLASVLHD